MPCSEALLRRSTSSRLGEWERAMGAKQRFRCHRHGSSYRKYRTRFGDSLMLGDNELLHYAGGEPCAIRLFKSLDWILLPLQHGIAHRNVLHAVLDRWSQYIARESPAAMPAFMCELLSVQEKTCLSRPRSLPGAFSHLCWLEERGLRTGNRDLLGCDAGAYRCTKLCHDVLDPIDRPESGFFYFYREVWACA
jgi:hypothetical protein